MLTIQVLLLLIGLACLGLPVTLPTTVFESGILLVSLQDITNQYLEGGITLISFAKLQGIQEYLS